MALAAQPFARKGCDALARLAYRPVTKMTAAAKEITTAGFAQMMLIQKHRVPEKPHGRRLKH